MDPKYGFIYVKLKLNELSGQIVNLKLAGKDNGVPELIGYAYVKVGCLISTFFPFSLLFPKSKVFTFISYRYQL